MGIPTLEATTVKHSPTTSTSTTRVCFTMGFGWSTTSRLATWRQRAESSSTTLRMTTVLRPLTTTGTSGRTETGFTTLASTCKPADHHLHHHHHHFQQIS